LKRDHCEQKRIGGGNSGTKGKSGGGKKKGKAVGELHGQPGQKKIKAGTKQSRKENCQTILFRRGRGEFSGGVNNPGQTPKGGGKQPEDSGETRLAGRKAAVQWREGGREGSGAAKKKGNLLPDAL